MVAVAIVAILIGVGLELSRRSRRFARLAADHSNGALEHFGTLMAFGGEPPPRRDVPPAGLGPDRYLHRARALLRHHSALTEKYLRAARYPWLPVAPDPLEPE
jgi:hypothetical protein